MILDTKKYVSYRKDNLYPKLIVSQHIEGDSKKGQQKLILGVTLAIIILVSAISYFFIIQQSKPPPEIILTKEQKEVDDFLKEYYFAYGNVSINRILPLFDSEAILSAPDGSVYNGTNSLRTYYSNVFANFESFTIAKKTIVKIEVRNEDAHAVYDIRMRIWRFGATDPPQLFFRDDFGLKKKGDKWSISGLVTVQTAAR